ncbi:hypothetical protein APY04_2101 [Hyphomicrobium sulfonivorans]|uniref:Uncharacterized protein n=1 Tax=Hyphomicrobium sulfonivorans TaxID=121290 RepID=A0A109BE25_HYPSL|nr:hypothetical protein APY04_2101 [Hyphomicrobium sulfonivorans]
MIPTKQEYSAFFYCMIAKCVWDTRRCSCMQMDASGAAR